MPIQHKWQSCFHKNSLMTILVVPNSLLFIVIQNYIDMLDGILVTFLNLCLQSNLLNAHYTTIPLTKLLTSIINIFRNIIDGQTERHPVTFFVIYPQVKDGSKVEVEHLPRLPEFVSADGTAGTALEITSVQDPETGATRQYILTTQVYIHTFF